LAGELAHQSQDATRKEQSDDGDSKPEQGIVHAEATDLHLVGEELESYSSDDRPENGARSTQEAIVVNVPSL